MSTAIIDYEQLNDAAQVLYQEAHRRGLGEGEEKGRRECADWHMRGNIDLAEQMLRRAANVEIEDEAQALAIFARMLLSRTPLMHPAISETLSLLRDRSAHVHADPEQFTPCARKLHAALSDLGGYV